MADKRSQQEITVDSALMRARGHILQSLGDMDRMSGKIIVSVEANVFNGDISSVELTQAFMSQKLPMPRAR